MFWPPFSPDLNPVETVGNKLKDYIAKHYPEKTAYDQLREAVKPHRSGFRRKSCKNWSDL
jgi:transposase